MCRSANRLEEVMLSLNKIIRLETGYFFYLVFKGYGRQWYWVLVKALPFVSFRGICTPG
jgi:hypothetical protein